MTTHRRFSFEATVNDPSSPNICSYLAVNTGLSKGKVKDAMIKGAVWLSKQGVKRRRLRRATVSLGSEDIVELYYDEDMLGLKPPVAHCLDDRKRYSVWVKPAGLMAQGTDYGDHCALLRQVEIHFRPHRPVFLVHRLDREATGLMVIAHDRHAAAQLSALFRDNRIAKSYRVRVRGALPEKQGEIRFPLGGKEALTRYTVTDYAVATDVATLDVCIETGRLHQIRRHFDMVGHPVLGDPKYGTGNKNSEGMWLEAVGLRFHCPFSGLDLDYAVHENVNRPL